MTNPFDQGQVTGRIGHIVKDTYRLTRIIGRGGMGEVYEAEHVSIPRRFAVKFLLGDLGLGSEVLTRFHREASIAASLGSAHIIEVFDFGQSADGSYFMVMELLEGDTLQQRIAQQGAFTLEAWLHLFAQLTDGLEAAHAAGIVHRDLKPDNVFLARNKSGVEILKILDFGISKIRVTGTQVTQTGAVMGTPSYMPPEQAEGATSTTDARADVFSLGAIVYEALSGRLAFAGPTVPAVILKVCFGEPEPLETVAPHVPPSVAAVVMRALRKTPDERYQSVREFFDDYRAALKAAPSPAQPVPQPIALAETVSSTASPSAFSATVSAPDSAPGQVDTTLSGAAAEIHPVDLPAMDTGFGTGTGTGARGRWRVVSVAIAALVVIGGAAAFFTIRGSGGGQPSAATAPASAPAPATADAGSPPSVITSPIPRLLPDAGLPATSSDAAVTPRPARPRTTRPRRTGRPMRPVSMHPVSMRPLPRSTAVPDRPRPRPLRPMLRRPPRRRPPMRRVPPRPRRRRSSKWAT